MTQLKYSSVEDILKETLRCAPILQALADGKYDSLMHVGSSLRVRDKKSGYFRFVINHAEDIRVLTKGISGFLHRLIVVDADYEDSWRTILPDAEYKHYKMSVVTTDTLLSLPQTKWPKDVCIVPMDRSWEELVISLCADDEFTAESLRNQIKENLSLGLVWEGKRAGFYSKHLNGEMGPFWITPGAHRRGFGTILKQEYLREFLKDNAIGFGLIDPDNAAIIKINESMGIQVLDKEILHITVRK